MRALDIVLRAGRSLKTAKARTLLTSLAIAVGALTLTITLAAGNGIRAYTDRLVSNNFDPAELLVGRDAEIENTGAPNSAPKEYDETVTNMTVGGDGSALQIKQITDEDVEKLRDYDFVEQVRPNYLVSPQYIEGESNKRYTLSVQSYNPGQKPEVTAGSLPESGDVKEGEVLLPTDYVKLLGFESDQDAVGKKVTITVNAPFTEDALRQYIMSLGSGNRSASGAPEPESEQFEYTVRAVTKKGTTSINLAGMPVMLSNENTGELYDFTTEGTNNYGKYMYAYVRVKEAATNEAAAEEAKKVLKADGYYVQTSQDIQKTITQFVDILQAMVAVFGIITIVASVFGIINTMYISVLERTREIGLMKALGMRGTHVAWLFRIEAAWIGLIGGLLGAVAAYVIGSALNPWITKQLSLGEGNSILLFDPIQIGVLIGVLTLVAILAGWLPARKAAKLDPIEALRTE